LSLSMGDGGRRRHCYAAPRSRRGWLHGPAWLCSPTRHDGSGHVVLTWPDGRAVASARCTASLPLRGLTVERWCPLPVAHGAPRAQPHVPPLLRRSTAQRRCRPAFPHAAPPAWPDGRPPHASLQTHRPATGGLQPSSPAVSPHSFTPVRGRAAPTGHDFLAPSIRSSVWPHRVCTPRQAHTRAQEMPLL
jgi:hypothetical protein